MHVTAQWCKVYFNFLLPLFLDSVLHIRILLFSCLKVQGVAKKVIVLLIPKLIQSKLNQLSLQWMFNAHLSVQFHCLFQGSGSSIAWTFKADCMFEVGLKVKVSP